MTELHPDRLLDGGTAPRDGAATPLRGAAAATPDRRRSPAGTAAQRKAPQRRQGETSPTGDTAPTRPARPSPRPRPTPHPRTGAAGAGAPADLEVRAVVVGCDEPVPADVVDEVLAAAPVTDAAGLVEVADAQARAAVVATLEAPEPAADPVPTADAGPDVEPADGPADADVRERVPVTVVAGHGRHREVRRIRLPRRRPAFHLAAALLGAVAVATFSTGDHVAQADGPQAVSASVSVAQELGIDREELSAAAEEATLRSDAVLLGAVTASRTAREAEEAAAAQAQADADRVAAEAAAAAAAEAARPKTVLPVAGARLTSTFGARWGTLHAGIDLAAPMLTPEYAAADGVVLEAGPASGYGNVVYIQHGNGDVTVYGHMEEILVQPGQVVRAGDTIALLGNRGQSTGPHLHFEVHVGGIDGQKVDPIPWLRERGVSI